ncbi:hypothetical protein [Fundidesulfovibrio soli]|uniref:hypothetical protein n=1 Tax=Fundidesulfovibrio soli TaxID=2922716 RepID=UPI001FAE8C27|nr:hypothetical protein [Fundidesulfovibrio soli]
MRIRLNLALLLLAALFSPDWAMPEAQAQDRTSTGSWAKMPANAKLCYMTGAAAGTRAFAEITPGEPKLKRVRIDQAVTNMDHFAADPLYQRQPMTVTAYRSLQMAQDKGIRFKETGEPLRDPQFDDSLLFEYPWLWPIDLDAFIPEGGRGPKPTFAQTWLKAEQFAKMFFLEGFGDMAVGLCNTRLGNTPKGQTCMKALMPLPMESVASQMDSIYHDPAYAHTGYDLVARAALLKMVGDDWRSVLAVK